MAEICPEKTNKRGVYVAIVMMIFGVLGFLWFLMPLIMYGSLNLGNITGMLVFAVLFIYGYKSKDIKFRFENTRETKSGKAAIRVISGFLSVILALIVVETGLMIKAVLDEPERNATVVVLGCRVMPGEKPSLMLAERLDAAYDYLSENPDSVCILSGGQGKNEDISEAECMYRYLVNKGISPDRLYKEDKSTSTRENLKFSGEIIEKENLPSEIAIVSNEFHLYRAGLIADELGIIHSSVPACTAIWLLPTYYVRELYGIIYQWVF